MFHLSCEKYKFTLFIDYRTYLNVIERFFGGKNKQNKKIPLPLQPQKQMVP